MAYFWTCPDCGSNLDPGERCDCHSSQVISVAPEKKKDASQPAKQGKRLCASDRISDPLPPFYGMASLRSSSFAKER